MANGQKVIGNHQNVIGAKSLPSHREPTWGDIGKLVLIANGLGLTNSSNLLSAFGSPATVKDLQTCRNASAHFSKDKVTDVKIASVRYGATKFTHPSDMMFWTDLATADFLWRSWISEIEAVSALAVS